MTPAEAIVELGAALETIKADVDNLQVVAGWATTPSPPTLDVYPDPSSFLTYAAMGAGQSEAFFLIRARVNTADQQGGQDLLLRMLDPLGPASVEQAIEGVATVDRDGITGFSLLDPFDPALLTCTWRVRLYL